MERIAIIFDNSLRPETTGIYCRRALGELAQAGRITEVEHFLPSELEHVPRNRFDLFLFVDDGLAGRIPDDLRPAAWWAIDTHVEYERCLAMARQADVTFAAQKKGAQQLKSAGISATWLPLACDPDLHGKQDARKEFDVCFIGNIFPGERARLLELIQSRYAGTRVQCAI
jgi:hypothetical protein